MKKFYTFEPKNFRIFTKMKSFLAVALLLLMAVGTANAQTAQLVTDASELSVGDQIIIVATGTDVALSTTQTTNNRGVANITRTGTQVTYGSDVEVITLQAGFAGNFAMSVSGGYLYAASSSNNHLKTQSSIDANASWSFTSNGTSMDIVAQGSYTHNILRYNSTSTLFSCYLSGQQAVSVYKVEVAPCTEERTDNVAICEYSFDHSRDYYNFNGTNLLPKDAGTHLDTIHGVGGACDTIVTLNLSVIPGEYEYSLTMNEGDTVRLKDQIITVNGDYYDYFLGSETSCGCDSSVTLHVTFTPINTTYEEVASACVGSTYTFPLFNGLDTNIICTETYIYEFLHIFL